MTHQAANILLSVALLAVLVRLYFWDYREYRVQRTRFKLFVLRDQLFALARSGAVSFDAPAYQMLRMMMNGAIRFAARASVLDMVIVLLLLHTRPGFLEARDRQAERWDRALKELDSKSRTDIVEIHERYLRVVIEQTFLSSMIGTIVLMPLVCGFILGAVSKICARTFYGWVIPRFGLELDVIATGEAKADPLPAAA